MRTVLILFLSAFAAFLLFPATSAAQSRDYFTDDEVEVIREAQQLDVRMNVLAHAIDRRFGVLKIDVAAPRIGKKENEAWGPLPTGSRFALLSDIKKILQKAVDDINNLAERPDSLVVFDTGKKEKPPTYGDIFPKAVRNLGAAAVRYKPVLTAEIANAKDEAERGVMMDSIEFCDQIIEAASKVPADVKKPKH